MKPGLLFDLVTDRQKRRCLIVTFTDANSLASAGAFTVSIDWGDGSPMSAGTVTQAGGIFSVAGLHTYADALVNGGSHPFDVKVWVTDKEGANLFTNVTQTVNDVPIVVTGQLNNVTAPASGQTFTLTTPAVLRVSAVLSSSSPVT